MCGLRIGIFQKERRHVLQHLPELMDGGSDPGEMMPAMPDGVIFNNELRGNGRAEAE